MLERLEILIGKDNIEKIKSKNILLIGLGGVGGYAFESLIRSGIENITIGILLSSFFLTSIFEKIFSAVISGVRS